MLLQRFEIRRPMLADRADEIGRKRIPLVNVTANFTNEAFLLRRRLRRRLNMFKVKIIRHRSIVMQNARLRNLGDKDRVRTVIRARDHAAGEIRVGILIQIKQPVGASAHMAEIGKLVGIPPLWKPKWRNNLNGAPSVSTDTLKAPVFAIISCV